MNTLVTGGAGFIGSHLAERLLKDGHRVTVLDNFATGRRENLAHLSGSKNLNVVQADVADFALAKPLLEGMDWVFHLAGLADIVPSIKKPLDYHHSNVDGTASILEASRLAGVKRFIYTASSSCYGIPEVTPTPETARIKVEYPYALTKYIGEQFAMHWGKVYKLPVVSLRLFNVYGPRSRTTGAYGAVFGVFLAQKYHNKPFTVVGDGSQTRDFTFVSDVAAAFVKAAESDVAGEIFNVGSGGCYSVDYLAGLLGGKKIYIPKRPGEPDCTWADISKIKRMLGWQPVVSFEEGVRIMLGHIEHWKDAPLWTPEKIGEATKDWFKYLAK